MVRAAFMTWLVGSTFILTALALVIVYLTYCGYFASPMLEEFSFEKVQTVAAFALLVGGHLVSRRARQRPRCRRTTMSFGAATSYRLPPEVTHTCASPTACTTRASLALHQRTAIGVATSLAIAAIGMRAILRNPDLGGYSCMSAPIDYGGHILLYWGLAAIAVVSHAPSTSASSC